MNAPEWSNDARKHITIDNLLRMSSGLDFEEVYHRYSDATVMLFQQESMGGYTASRPLIHNPGTHWFFVNLTRI